MEHLWAKKIHNILIPIYKLEYTINFLSIVCLKINNDNEKKFSIKTETDYQLC